MLLKRWEPYGEVRRMDGEFDRVWRHFLRPYRVGASRSADVGYVPIDVYQEGDNTVVRASLPGIKPEELEVTLVEDKLSIVGTTKFDKEIKEENYLHRENRYGSFQRVVTLPSAHDPEKVEAAYEDGVLTITIPKDEKSAPKSIKVEVRPSKDAKN